MKNFIQKMMKKFVNRETILYAVFGVATSVENVVLFKVLLMTSLEYKIANLITLIVVKVTAYICNKNFVFKSKCPNMIELLKEIWRFIVARGATMLIDYFGLIIMVELLHLPKMPSKVFLTVFVIVINYVIGKRHVFKNTPKEESV
jgi:putative flippase GtrA